MRKKMWKRTISVILCTGMAVSLLAGCGKAEKDTGKKPADIPGKDR